MLTASVPYGFIAISDLRVAIHTLLRQKEVPPWLTGRGAGLTRDGDLADPEAFTHKIMLRVGRMLASGDLRAAGQDQKTGEVVWITPETWGISPFPSLPNKTNVALAMGSEFVRIVGGDRQNRLCLPMLTFDAFNQLVGRLVEKVPLSVEPVELQPPVPTIVPEAAASSPAPEPLRSSSGGRQPRHDWDAFWIEVAWYTGQHDLELDHRPDLQRHMEEWATKTWLDPPDPGTIRKKIKALFARVTPPN